MRVKPILFSAEMVRAILDGRKTVTRRLVRCSHRDAAGFNIVKNGNSEIVGVMDYDDDERSYEDYTIPPYRPGDILYVRETWRKRAVADNSGNIYAYKADVNEWYAENDKSTRWRPSIHMPREAARIFLRVTGVRVQRLQEIDEDGAIAEGCSAGRFETTGGPWGVEDNPDEWAAREDFSHVWDSTIKHADLDRYGWAANPWVWVIHFERCEKPEGETHGNG